MMKTYKNLYPQIYAWNNLERAYRQARRGKRKYRPVADFEYNWESELLRLQTELINHTYQPGPYHSFYIHDPKRRLISAAPFRDRVTHHALCNLIEPIFERCFIDDSIGIRVVRAHIFLCPAGNVTDRPHWERMRGRGIYKKMARPVGLLDSKGDRSPGRQPGGTPGRSFDHSRL